MTQFADNVCFTFIFSDNSKELMLPPSEDEELKRALAMSLEQEEEEEGLHFIRATETGSAYTKSSFFLILSFQTTPMS